MRKYQPLSFQVSWQIDYDYVQRVPEQLFNPDHEQS